MSGVPADAPRPGTTGIATSEDQFIGQFDNSLGVAIRAHWFYHEGDSDSSAQRA